MSYSNQKKIMVSHGDLTLCSTIKTLLEDQGFYVILARDGLKALQLLEIESPQLALLDIALPGLYGFEIVEFIRMTERMKDTKVILLASIYDKTRYKRPPTSLYGADDYIELHHISDSLIPKINHLLGMDTTRVVLVEDVSQRVKEVSLFPQDVRVSEAAHQGARRLARLIVSDIALYNQELVEKGVREGRFYELLKEDIKEAEAYYSKRVPPELLKHTSYLKDAFEEFIEKTKTRLGTDLKSSSSTN